jgi:hypothetical protein
MKFLITLEGTTAKELIEGLDQARQQLITGRCFLNTSIGLNGDARMKPVDDESENEYRRQYADAHPSVPAWPK